jgi:hypothetical protein
VIVRTLQGCEHVAKNPDVIDDYMESQIGSSL